jgi:hypothetical protein
MIPLRYKKILDSTIKIYHDNGTIISIITTIIGNYNNQKVWLLHLPRCSNKEIVHVIPDRYIILPPATIVLLIE